ncbi:MAG: hypothetical protein HYS07_07315 [Chlamydiae bacterium]|nr:hypothetical protein [Chlamydiota bacterium]MBI3276643.1 hypothetical protein [Chlamydiota bacterium]
MKKIQLTGIAVLSLCLLHSVAWAEEEGTEKSEKSETQQNVTKVVTYPVNVVRETGKVALGVGEKVLNTAADTAQTTGQVLTGDVKQAPNIVMTPVKDTAEGLVATATATASIPLEAAKDSEEAAK